MAIKQAPMRSREQVEQRLSRLIRYLAMTEEIDDMGLRVHARALDLVWILYPSLDFEESLRLINQRILALDDAKKGEPAP